MKRFPFDFALPLSLPLRFLGVRPGTARVDVHDEHLEVVFGPWRLLTSLGNVEDATVTGPYNPLKAYGVRVSLSDLGVTFGTTSAAGLCIRFREPVGAAVPGGLLRHPSVTVTVADPEALRRLLLRVSHEPRPLLAAVEGDISDVPVQEPAEDTAARQRVARRARQAARTRVQHREEERRQAEQAAAERSAVARRAAATRAANRAQAQAEEEAQERREQREARSAARATQNRTPQKRTAQKRTAQKRTTQSGTPRKRAASRRTPAGRTSSAVTAAVTAAVPSDDRETAASSS